MAEYVHQRLEEMLPELEEMTRSELFTPEETKVILKKREALEYRLQQHTKTKNSFLNYIEYERKLLELIFIRKKQLGLDYGRKDLENAIKNRINKLFWLLTTRFSEDVSLWEMHIAFCKETKQLQSVTRLYKKILRIHSHREDIWVKAAQFERSPDGSGNPEAARELLLMGQRVMPDSEIIYLEMYQMELDLATVLIKRKKVLKIADPVISTEAEGKTSKKKKKKNVKKAEAMETDGEVQIYEEFKVAQIVYKKALEIFPNNPEFHLKLLNICSKFKLASCQLAEMIASLKKMYPDDPTVWNALALCQLNKYKKLMTVEQKMAADRCLATFKEGLQAVQMANEGTGVQQGSGTGVSKKESMWNHCLWGHLNVLELRHDNEDASEILTSTLELFQNAINDDTLSRELYEKLIKMLTDMGMSDDAAAVAERSVQSYPSSASLWQKHISKMAERGVVLDDVVKTFQAARRKITEEDSWPVWQTVLNLVSVTDNSVLESLLEEACRCVTPQVSKPAKEWSLDFAFRQGGIKKARKVYRTLKCMRPITVEFYRMYVIMENSQLEPHLQLIRSAFEEALAEFGQLNQGLWLNYMDMERKIAQDAPKAGLIHQRALKCLSPALKEDFHRAITMIGLTA